MAASFVIGYLVGSVPLGLVVAYVVGGIDIRRRGTGGIGASNVLHNLGLVPAAVVALGVFLQGLLPPLAVIVLGGPEAAATAAAVGAVIGYNWSVFLGFEGTGRGVGVSTGAAAAVSPGGFVPLLVAYGIGRLLKQMGLATLVGFLVYGGWVLYFSGSVADRVAALLLLALILLRRLEGVRKDLRRSAPFPTLRDRLLFDRRPGQRLSGPADGERHG